MHRAIRWVGLALLILSAGAFAVWLNRNADARVPLSGGRQLRILIVSRGTNHIFSSESIWKQGLRRVFPKPARKWLGTFQAGRILTHHDSLVVWVDKVHPVSGHIAVTKSERFEAVLPDGSVAEGTKHDQQGGLLYGIEFSRFARAVSQVPLQLRDGTNVFSFVVNNPQPVHAAQWTSKSLPQTNSVAQTKIVLSGSSPEHHSSGTQPHFQIHVQASTLDDGRPGWMSWRATGFDPLGNWIERSWTYSGSGRGLLQLPLLRTNNAPWKLRVEGREYISAGRVSSLTNESHMVGVLEGRARALGVRFLMVTGSGTYHITNGVVIRSVDDPAHALAQPAITFSPSTHQTNWSLRFATPAAGILCVFDRGDSYPAIQVRLRERIGGNGGNIFTPTRTVPVSCVSERSTTTASFFELWLPLTRTNLEAEIIATLPAVEFFIDPTDG